MAVQRRFFVPGILVATAAFVVLGATRAIAAPPVVTLDAPLDGSSSRVTRPIFSGTSDCTQGSCSNITVSVYAGTTVSGLPIQTLTAPRGASWSATASALADGTYTATASQTRPTGNGGTSTTPETTFVIDTTGPVVTFQSPPSSSNEGSTASFSYTIDDGQGVGGGSVVVDCGSVSPTNVLSGSFDCAYADGDSSETVSVTATDALGNVGPQTSVVLPVDNVAPTTAFDSGPSTRTEGDSGTYSFTFSDPGDDTIDSVDVSCGSGSSSNVVFDNSGVAFDCTFPSSGTTSVTAAATDSDGGNGPLDSTTVDVANVAPTTTFESGPATLDEGDSATYSFTFSDPGDDTIDSVDVSCGSGTSSNVAFDDSAVNFDCTFPDSGTTSVTAAATDSDGDTGASASTTVEVTAVPEPTPEPTPDPTTEPTPDPTTEPTPDPTTESTPDPTTESTPDPTVEPPAAPTPEPAADSSPGPSPDSSSDENVESDTGNSTDPDDGSIVTGWPLPKGEVTLDTDVISPNNDGELDAVTIAARFTEPVWWTFELRDDGETLLTKSGFGFSFEHVWDGTVEGNVVPNGDYGWRVTARSSNASMTPVSGSLSVDADAPDFMQVSVAKGGRTAASIDVVVSEDSDIVVAIRRGKRIIRTMGSAAKSGQRITFKWNGRNSYGRRMRPGRYKVTVRATDAAANVSVAPRRTIRL